MPNPFGSSDDGFSPFSGPLLRALSLASAMGVLPWQKQARAEHEQDRQRAQQTQDALMQMKLADAGAQPAEPGANAASDDILRRFFAGPDNMRPLVTAPTGAYRLPSRNEQEARELDDYSKKQAVNTVEINLADRLPGVVPGDRLRVPRTSAVTALRELGDVQRQIRMGVSPDLKNLLNLSVDSIDLKPGELPSYINALKPRQHDTTDAAGVGHVTATDPLTGKIIGESQTAGAVGKPQREPSPGEKSLPSSVMEQLKTRAGNMALLQLKAQYPNGVETTDYRSADPTTKRLLEMQGRRFEKNLRSTDEYHQVYSQLLDGYIGDETAKRAKLQPKGSTAAPRASAPAPPAPSAVKASKLPDLLRKAQALDPSVTTIDELRRRLKAKGVTIDEGN